MKSGDGCWGFVCFVCFGFSKAEISCEIAEVWEWTFGRITGTEWSFKMIVYCFSLS